QLRLRLDRDFSPRARGSVAVRIIDDEGPAGFNERRYGVASVGAEWRFTQAWSLVGRYDYIWQNYRLTPGSASSNAVRLSVSWQPRREARDDASLFEYVHAYAQTKSGTRQWLKRTPQGFRTTWGSYAGGFTR